MTRSSPVSGSDALPELDLFDHLDVFVPGAIQGPVRISREQPLTGELLRDSTCTYFLSPEEDYRGGGMGAIRIHNLSAIAMARYVNKVVKVAGVFEDGIGVTVEAIALVGAEFKG